MSGNTFEALLGPNLGSVQTLVQRRLRTSDQGRLAQVMASARPGGIQAVAMAQSRIEP
jgi:hypothetical protein